MQNIPQRKSLLIIILFVFAFLSLAAIPARQEKPPGILGTILINIEYVGSKFIEFKLQDGKLLKMSEGKTIPYNWEKKFPRFTAVNISRTFTARRGVIIMKKMRSWLHYCHNIIYKNFAM
jgi:hypothetical protein